ncbi:MAG: hypothetical protein NTX33_18160 [Propionibacteriales bacterium]|nr:hypothetical protein [Propionibacteriales bacterium]
MSQPSAVDRFLDAVRLGRIDDCDAWAEDATLDATVPNWRFHRTGADRIRETYRGWFADPGAFEQLRREPTATGEAVAYTLSWNEGGIPHAAHHAHFLDVVDDRIVADVVLCGGRWPASLLAEMEAADE